MKRAILCFLAVGFGVPLFAGQYRVNVSFEKSRVRGKWGGDFEVRAGYPQIPVETLRWLVPYQEKFVSAKVTPLFRTKARVRMQYPVNPIYRPACDGTRAALPKAPSFAENEAYPKKSYGSPYVVEKNGYSVLFMPLYPARYFPGRSEEEQLSGMEIEIETKASEPHPLYRGTQEDRAEVQQLIGDQGNFDVFPATVRADATAEYLIIGPESFLHQDSLLMFLAEKTSRGITNTFRTLEDIKQNVTGANDQEKIRNAIKAAYKDLGTKYVLLVGDGYSVLPTKNTSVGGEIIPTDLYYACLDNFPGDMACEVAVGRAPASKPEDFLRFLVKTMQMSMLLPDDPIRSNELNFGEKMDSNTLGSKCVDQLLTGGKAGSIPTKGFPASVKPTKLYETFSKTFSASEVIDTINKGDFFTVNHLGHANQTYDMRFKTSDMPKFTNATPFFAITQGCHPGDLRGKNWAQLLITSTASGAGAVIANSSYGWYSPGKADGPSNRHHLLFYDSVFAEDMDQIGRANYRAKERLIPQATSDDTMKKVVHETNLFGDPELRLRIPN